MDSTVNMEFENKCLDTVKQAVLEYSVGIEGKIFLFGSRAAGCIRRGADIDIGFEGFSDMDFRKIKRRLGLFWEESFVPYHLDLVNFNYVRKEFKEKAMETTIQWKNR